MKNITGEQEDEIYRVKEFITELGNVQELYFERLREYMGYKSDSDDDEALFDYIYNHSKEETFEEYLDRFN